MKDERGNAAARLLDRGVRFRLPAFFLLRWLRMDSITLRAFKAGTMLRCAEVVVKNDLEVATLKKDTERLQLLIRPISECIAISALNSYWKILFFKKWLTKYLLWQVSEATLVEMFLVVAELNNTSNFTNITSWYIQQTKTMLNPNLGQEQMGR